MLATSYKKTMVSSQYQFTQLDMVQKNKKLMNSSSFAESLTWAEVLTQLLDEEDRTKLIAQFRPKICLRKQVGAIQRIAEQI